MPPRPRYLIGSTPFRDEWTVYEASDDFLGAGVPSISRS